MSGAPAPPRRDPRQRGRRLTKSTCGTTSNVRLIFIGWGDAVSTPYARWKAIVNNAMSGTFSADDGQRDIQRAIKELAERLPTPLQPLARLVYNYRWAWLPGAGALFHDIDRAHWRRSGCNPRHVIEAVPPRRLQELSRDEPFVARLRTLADRADADLRQPWADCGIQPDRPVAYFCSEFAIHCSLPIYSGGLGVLAGDMLKAASDLAIPMVGVGLLYREGYFHQRMDTAGWQHEYWITNDFERLPVALVTGPDEEPLTVQLVIRERVVKVQV